VIVVLALVAVIVACVIAGAVLVWDKPPWWREKASPRRIVKDARYRIKVSKLQHRHPEAFVVPLPQSDTVVFNTVNHIEAGDLVAPGIPERPEGLPNAG
jgi:hypothetical protein